MCIDARSGPTIQKERAEMITDESILSELGRFAAPANLAQLCAQFGIERGRDGRYSHTAYKQYVSIGRGLQRLKRGGKVEYASGNGAGWRVAKEARRPEYSSIATYAAPIAAACCRFASLLDRVGEASAGRAAHAARRHLRIAAVVHQRARSIDWLTYRRGRGDHKGPRCSEMRRVEYAAPSVGNVRVRPH